MISMKIHTNAVTQNKIISIQKQTTIKHRGCTSIAPVTTKMEIYEFTPRTLAQLLHTNYKFM